MTKENQLYKNDIRLNNPRAVQRLLARTINALNKGRMTESRARAIGYLAQILLKGFEVVDFEERLAKLEEIANGGRGE